MNPPELVKLAQTLDLESKERLKLRVRFGIACIERVEHLLTDNLVVEAFAVGKAYVSGESDESELNNAALAASDLARSHAGSGSIDGSGSGAVTTSRGVAAALQGRALDAAAYAAYASVYSYASHAVTDLSAYKSEHVWQIAKLESLVKDSPPDAGAFGPK